MKQEVRWEDIMEATKHLSEEFMIGCWDLEMCTRQSYLLFHFIYLLINVYLWVAEYAYSMKAIEKSDAYSIRIVLMEILMGRKPMDDAFGMEMDMARWVEMILEMKSGGREELIDPRLKSIVSKGRGDGHLGAVDCYCTKSSSKRRHHLGKPEIY